MHKFFFYRADLHSSRVSIRSRPNNVGAHYKYALLTLKMHPHWVLQR
uniref:Uncharacterized protein n=1 Tax=Ascaris lumbricoides TaxID=6252 RepID=A0A0M3HR76_ASCLU